MFEKPIGQSGIMLPVANCQAASFLCALRSCQYYMAQLGAVWPNEAKVLDTHQPSYNIVRDRHEVEDNVVRR